MKTKITLTLILLGLFCHGNANAKSLVFATEATYPPFVSLNAKGQVVGYGADVVHAICQEMNASCQLVNAPWNSLIMGLKMGHYSALFGGMDVTPDREKVVDFTQTYYSNAVSFVTAKSSHLSLKASSFAGKIIGVQTGTTFEKYAKAHMPLAHIKHYASNMQALLDLKSQRVDAVLIDQVVAQKWLKQQSSQQFKLLGSVVSPQYFGPGHGIAINKSNPKLLKALNKALAQLKSSGKLKALQKQYFGS